MSESAQRRRKRRGLLRAAFSDIGRFGKISTVIAKHGFGQLACQLGLTKVRGEEDMTSEELSADPKGTARRFRALLEELGPTFIKLGQILSTRPDLLPEPFIQELSKLQDHVPPMTFEAVRAQIEASHDGTPLEELFTDFTEAPLATGSIAQTHLARVDDDEVVVKVQRPGLEALISSDLDLLRLLAGLLEATVEEMGLYTPSRIVEEFEAGLRRELDFQVEAANLKRFRELFSDDPRIWIPSVFDARSNELMLVMERIPGVKITDLEPGSERAHKLALQFLDHAYSMLFEHGMFHGDPHPGNVLVTRDDRIGLIDFGLVGHLSRQQQDILVGLILAVVSGDTDGIARSVLKMGHTEGRVPLREMREDIVAIRSRYLQSAIGTVDVAAFTAELLEAGQRYQIRVPADYALLTKAVVSIEGIVRHLYPTLDIPSALRPYARKLLVQRYGPQRLAQGLLSNALSVSGLLGEFPAQLTQLMMDLEHEGLRVQVENRGLSEMRGAMKALGARIVLGMLASALTVCLYLELARSPAADAQHSLMVTVLAFLLGGLLTTLLLWHLLEGRVRKLRITPFVRWFWGRRE